MIPEIMFNWTVVWSHVQTENHLIFAKKIPPILCTYFSRFKDGSNDHDE